MVSQFTLYGEARKGRRPTWEAAAPREVSEPVYDAVCDALEGLGAVVARGRFGEDMQVASVNDGPITLSLVERTRTSEWDVACLRPTPTRRFSCPTVMPAPRSMAGG